MVSGSERSDRMAMNPVARHDPHRVVTPKMMMMMIPSREAREKRPPVQAKITYYNYRRLQNE